MSEKLETLKAESADAAAAVENLEAEVKALEGAKEVDKEAVKAKKAELRTAVSTSKSLAKAVEKEEKAAAKEAEKAAKAAEREAAKKAREEERAKKKAEREAEKQRKAEEREKNRMPEQNGIRRPKPETICGQVWGAADDLSSKLGQPTPIAELLKVGESKGWNPGNVKAEYARWRKFHGVTGRITLPKQEDSNEAK